MSNVHLSDETLMAYADGELSGEIATAVVDAMRRDPATLARVADFVSSRQVARAAALRSGLPSVPADLLARVDHLVHRAGRRDHRGVTSADRPAVGRRRVATWLSPAIAAGLGLLSIYLVAQDMRRPTAVGDGASMVASFLANPGFTAALSSNATGTETKVASATLRLIASYSRGGDLCREFEIAEPQSAFEALACRRDAGWQLLLLASKPGEGGYSTASGDGPVARFLADSDLGPPLGLVEERKALGAGP